MNIRITSFPIVRADIYEGEQKTYPGGAALLFAIHASEFTGVDAALIGSLGQDEHYDMIMNALSYRRIDIDCLKMEKRKPTLSALIKKVPDSEGRYYCDSTNCKIKETFCFSKKEKDLLMISDAVFTEYDPLWIDDVVDMKKHMDFKLIVSFSGPNEIRSAEAYLDSVDIILSSGTEEELPALREIADSSGRMVNVVLPDLSSVTYVDGKEYTSPAVPSDEYVDDTGCVESYRSAFVCTYLKDHDIPKAMNAGGQLAAVTFEHFGGF